MKHYRLSLSWPRLMRADRTPIEEGYAFYDALLDELRDAGITPYVTLHHWDFPDWLCARGPSADDASLGAVDPEGASRDPDSCPGAWLDPGVVADFQTYADQAFAPRTQGALLGHHQRTQDGSEHGLRRGRARPGHRVRHRAAGGWAQHALGARGGGEDVSREVPRRAGGLRDDGGQLGLARTRAGGRSRGRRRGDARDGGGDGMVRGPAVFRRLPGVHARTVRGALPRFTEAQSASLRGSTDYFGLNHYTSLYASAAELSPANSYLGRAMDWTTSDAGADGAPIGDSSSCAWLKDVPWGLGKTLDYVKIRYENPPVYITENGVSANPAPDAPLDQALDDASRVKYISGYLKATLGALRGGADVRGYFYWSVFDNFEWAEGSATRFGLVHVDHRGTYGGEWTTRHAKRSLGFYRDFMIGRHSEGAPPRRGKIFVPAADASDAFYGGEPLPWETTTEPEAPRAAALGLSPATRTNAASASASVSPTTASRRGVGGGESRAGGARQTPRPRRARSVDARRERGPGRGGTRGGRAAGEVRGRGARRGRGGADAGEAIDAAGEDPVADRLLSDAARALSDDAAYASASSASASSSNDADALLAEAERVLALAERKAAARRRAVAGSGSGCSCRRTTGCWRPSRR